MKDLELLDERRGVAGAGGGDAPEDLLRREQVLRPGTAVQLVLQAVLDFLLELGRDVVAVRDIADARQRLGPAKLFVPGRQVGVNPPRSRPSRE